MIELYHNGMSTCSQKVRLALTEKNQDFKSHIFNLRAGEHKNEAYLKLNPKGVVPTLVYDTTVICESTVINEYIDDCWSTPPLRSQDAFQRARMRIWTKQLDEGVHAMGGVLSFALVFRHELFDLKGEEETKKMISNLSNPEQKDFMTENVINGLDSRLLPGAIARYKKLIVDMDKELAETKWLAGRDYSLADIGLTPYILRLYHLQMAWMWSDFPRIADWFERVQERSNYQNAVVKWYNEDAISLMAEKGSEAEAHLKKISA